MLANAAFVHSPSSLTSKLDHSLRPPSRMVGGGPTRVAEEGISQEEKDRIMAKGNVPTQTSHRSSRTGRFVTEQYADRHPATTQRERNKHPERK